MWITFFMCFALVCAGGDCFDLLAGDNAGREAPRQQRGSSVVPLEGLDPVLLAGGKEAQGDEAFAVTRGQFRYLFAGAETKAAFEKEPGRFEIQLGGACAKMGPTVRGNPDLFLVHEGRIYIFGSEECVKAFRAKRELEAKLDPSKFARVHRSSIVNLDRVKKLQQHFNGDYLVVMHDGTQLKLSRSRRERFRSLLEGG